MLHAIRSYLSYRAAVQAEADELIREHGPASVDVARKLAFAAMRAGGDPDRAWCVSAVVERRLGVRDHPDTATRYLEGARGAGRHPWMW